jgi:hypothetical protein
MNDDILDSADVLLTQSKDYSNAYLGLKLRREYSLSVSNSAGEMYEEFTRV